MIDARTVILGGTRRCIAVYQPCVDIGKLGEAILLIANKCKDSEGFSSTVLNKVLYEADLRHYARSGRAITNARYVHLDYGPGPHELPTVRDALVQSGDLEIELRPYHNYTQKRPIANREADVSSFSESELQDLEWAIKQVGCVLNATQASDRTHDEPWQLTDEGDAIPYELVFLRGMVSPSDDETEQLIAMAKELDLL